MYITLHDYFHGHDLSLIQKEINRNQHKKKNHKAAGRWPSSVIKWSTKKPRGIRRENITSTVAWVVQLTLFQQLKVSSHLLK